MSIECVVVDGGARYGLHPTWNDLRRIATFHLFEMDVAEAGRLRTKYKDDANIHVYPFGLYREDRVLEFTANKHRALNSLFAAHTDILRRNEYMREAFTPTEVLTTEVRSIDGIFGDTPVHFVKLDVEGAEFEVLSGAMNQLESSVLGVRAEVLFSPVYKGAALFGDVHRLLIDAGFELLNFDYVGAGNKAGRFALPGRYGKLISTDAVWVVNNDRIFSQSGNSLRDCVIRLACFMVNNGSADLAIDTLRTAVLKHDVSFDSVEDDPLFVYLHRKLLLIFKDLLSLPMWSHDEITGVYKEIFDLEFPALNRFYESEIFS